MAQQALGGLGGIVNQGNGLLNLNQLQAERTRDIEAIRVEIYGSLGRPASLANKKLTFKEELQDEIDQWLEDI